MARVLDQLNRNGLDGNIAAFEVCSYIVIRRAGKQIRPSSAPYVSGDLFRSIAHLIVDETNSHVDLNSIESGSIVFVKTDYWKHFFRFALTQPQKVSKLVILIHNGDMLPDPNQIEASRFGAVFAVNALAHHEAAGIIGIPIGLENAHHNNFGFVPEFHSIARGEPETRDIEVFASFHVDTNRSYRQPWKQWALRNGIWCEPDKTVRQYFGLVKRSKFVLSPPGNGPDCHRTWEALYLGATPIIDCNSLAPSLISTLPVLPVEGFDLDNALSNRYQHVAKNMEQAYAYYWINRVINTASKLV